MSMHERGYSFEKYMLSVSIYFIAYRFEVCVHRNLSIEQTPEVRLSTSGRTVVNMEKIIVRLL